MPAGTYMYRQSTARGRKIQTFPILTILGRVNISSFGHQMGICAKNYKYLPSIFFMGINGLMSHDSAHSFLLYMYF